MFTLTTRQYVSGQPLATVEVLPDDRIRREVGIPWATQCSLNQRPASSQPTTVATVHEFVGSTGKSSFGTILPCGEPANQRFHVEILCYRPMRCVIKA